MSSSRRFSVDPSRLAARTCLALACFVACSDDDPGPAAPPDLPELTIEGFLASDGVRLERFAPGDTVGVPCDGPLTVLVGPTDTAGRLENWELRPPGTCGRIANCGYLVARLFDSAGAELASEAAATAHVPLDVTTVPLATGYRVTVELRQGTSGDLVTVAGEDGEPVPLVVEATLSLEARECPSAVGTGGMGGNTGEGGMAGFGGLGGAAQ